MGGARQLHALHGSQPAIFLVSRNPRRLYICEPGYGSLAHVEDSWSILQDSYLKCFLFEYAATLGLLDVAYIPPHSAPQDGLSDYWGLDDLPFLSRYDGLLYFRLNPLGAFCLGLTEQYNPPEVASQTQLQIQANGTIRNPGPPLSPLATELLNNFAQTNRDGFVAIGPPQSDRSHRGRPKPRQSLRLSQSGLSRRASPNDRQLLPRLSPAL